MSRYLGFHHWIAFQKAFIRYLTPPGMKQVRVLVRHWDPALISRGVRGRTGKKDRVRKEQMAAGAFAPLCNSFGSQPLANFPLFTCRQAAHGTMLAKVRCELIKP